MQAATEQRVKQLLRRTIGEPHVGKRFKQRLLNRELAGLALSPTRILDAGAEDATFVYWLADRWPAASVLAVDIDADAIAACLAARPPRYDDRVRFEVRSFGELAAASLDLITALDVLEHIDDDAGAAAAFYRALAPGGHLLVHVPRDQWTTSSGLVHRVPDSEAWTVNSGHVRSGYAPDALRALLAGAGFTVESVQTWTGRWGARAFEVYDRFEHPAPLRLLTLPVTDLCAALDRGPRPEGNTVFAHAVKPLDPAAPAAPAL